MKAHPLEKTIVSSLQSTQRDCGPTNTHCCAVLPCNLSDFARGGEDEYIGRREVTEGAGEHDHAKTKGGWRRGNRTRLCKGSKAMHFQSSPETSWGSRFFFVGKTSDGRDGWTRKTRRKNFWRVKFLRVGAKGGGLGSSCSCCSSQTNQPTGDKIRDKLPLATWLAAHIRQELKGRSRSFFKLILRP